MSKIRLGFLPLIGGVVWILLPWAMLAGGEKKDASWKFLFDGKTLQGWKSVNFGGEGEVEVENGAIVLGRGSNMTGAVYTGKDFPKTNYEVSLEGKKVDGFDFFATTTFPVGDTHCSLVTGGWGGSIVGLSSINEKDASENETKTFQTFKRDRWYRFRIRVTPNRIVAWIDEKKVVDQDIQGKKISLRAECNPCRPFGVASYNTVGAVRDVKVRLLKEGEK